MSCFQLPALGSYGNAGAYMTQAAGINNWDISLAKVFTIKEQHRITFRAEFFNAFNRTHFRKPGGRISENFSSSGVGRIGGLTVPPRQIQFALRYDF